ncbi:DUF1957 domain-containing protein [Thermoleophilia bacterium SCSIO 60948]|nr:DUF1957 domain-containing protein [Thermoleophilia bacterium SCSIO 60948]
MPEPERGSAGSLAVVLHSHMPYVEGFGTYPFGEEWLFDAYLRSYAPLLEIASGVTLTVTPVLADQLEADGVAERMLAFAEDLRLGMALTEAELVEPALAPGCHSEADRYRRSVELIRSAGGDLLAPFRDREASGDIALMTSAATHAVLPLLATEAGRRAQIDAGARSHRRRFGEPAGFWLPECAYEPGIEALLADSGMSCFCVDASGWTEPGERTAPIATGAGPRALPIDWDLVSRLWSLDGYPSDPRHRDFHRKTHRGARAWSIGDTGYDPEAAERRAREQAVDLLEAVAARLRALAPDGDGLLCFACDTELLGHWWWEGPAWLDELIARAPEFGVDLVTVPEALARHPAATGRPIAASTWGEGKDLRTWDSRAVADLATALRRLELRAVAELRGEAGREPDRALRVVRELFAAQASDWAFLDERRQAGDYPYGRAVTHAERMHEAIHSASPPDPRVRNLAPDLRPSALIEP